MPQASLKELQEANEKLRQENARLREENQRLRLRIDVLVKAVFGKKSERFDPNQLLLELGDEATGNTLEDRVHEPEPAPAMASTRKSRSAPRMPCR